MNIKDIAPFLISARRGNIVTDNASMTWSDGFKLHFREGGYGNVGKLSISFSRPRDAKGQYVSLWEASPATGQIHDPSINVGASKSPEQVAKDIKRRLLPDAERVFALASASVSDHNLFEVNKEWAIKKIAFHCGTQPDVHYQTHELTGEVDPYIGAGLESFKGNGYGKFKVSGKDHISLELNSMNIDIAVEIAIAIHAIFKKHAAKSS